MTISRDALESVAATAATSSSTHGRSGEQPANRYDELVARFALAVSANAEVWLYFSFMGTNYLMSLAATALGYAQEMMEEAEGTLYQVQVKEGSNLAAVNREAALLRATAERETLSAAHVSRAKAELARFYRNRVKGAAVVGQRAQKRGDAALKAYVSAKAAFLGEYSRLLSAVRRIAEDPLSISAAAGNVACIPAMETFSSASAAPYEDDPMEQFLLLAAAVSAVEAMASPEDPWSLQIGQQFRETLDAFPSLPPVSSVEKALFLREAGSFPAVVALCAYLADLCSLLGEVSSDTLSRMSITVPDQPSISSLCESFSPTFSEATKKTARGLMDAFAGEGFDFAEKAMRRGHPSTALSPQQASTDSRLSGSLNEVSLGLRS
jgi:hypothetical protein